MSEKYNGWTNYETWCVALWMDNEERTRRYWCDEAREALKNFEGPADAADRLADAIADDHQEGQAGIVGKPSVFSDLLNAALSEVNWHEIARHYIETVKEV